MCDHHHHHHDSETSLSFFFTYASTGWTSAEGRILLIYSVILITSSIFEIIFGFNTSDSHVVSEGFHTIFHALCIWSAMIALAYSSKHEKADSFCPFGYSRAQVIAAFGNSIFILFISLYSFFEAVHEILSGEASDSNQELFKMFTGKLFIHCLFFIHLWPYLFGKSRNSNDNLSVVALHCFGLLVTEMIRVVSLYYEFESSAYPMHYTEQILNVLGIFVVLVLIRPFLYRTANILLLCSLKGKIKEGIMKKIREISLVEGVVGVKDERLWMINANEVVGSIKVEVHGEAKGVVAKTQEIMKGSTTCLIVEVHKSD